MTTTQTKRPTTERHIPHPLVADSFINIKGVSSAYCMSDSWVYAEVVAGRLPKPIRFGSRCTRWRLEDIRQHLIQRAELGSSDAQSVELVTVKPNKATQVKQAAPVNAGGAA